MLLSARQASLTSCRATSGVELKSITGWEPLRLLVWHDDRPVAAISLLKRRLPLYRYLHRSIAYAPRGPIIGEGLRSGGGEVTSGIRSRAWRTGMAPFLSRSTRTSPPNPGRRAHGQRLRKNTGAGWPLRASSPAATVRSSGASSPATSSAWMSLPPSSNC